MTKTKPLPPVERLRELYDVDEERGLLVSRRTGRAVGHPRSKRNGLLAACTPWGQFFVHRLIWRLVHGEDPGPLDVDHINGDQGDNRPCNLRLATRAQNCRNQGPRVTNTSGYKGVTKNTGTHSSWRAQIRTTEGGVRRVVYLGSYATPEAAHAAYVAAANALSGEFARAA